MPRSPLFSLDLLTDPDDRCAKPREWDRQSYQEAIVPFIDPAGSSSDANPLLDSGLF